MGKAGKAARLSIRQMVIRAVLREVRKSVEAHLKKLLVSFAKMLIVAIIGIACLSVGSVVVMLGIVSYLHRIVGLWLAWELTGVGAVVVGGLMLLGVKRMITSPRAFSAKSMTTTPPARVEVASTEAHTGRGLKGLEEKYGIFRMVKFGVASASGFLIAEALLVIGVLLIYHRFLIPSNTSTSPILIGLNVFSFVIGVTAAFFINEKFTVRNELNNLRPRESGSVGARLLKYEGVNGAGNAVIIVVQLVLLSLFGLPPFLGSIVGAIVSYPMVYVVSMRVIWKTSPIGGSRRTTALEDNWG